VCETNKGEICKKIILVAPATEKLLDCLQQSPPYLVSRELEDALLKNQALIYGQAQMAKGNNKKQKKERKEKKKSWLDQTHDLPHNENTTKKQHDTPLHHTAMFGLQSGLSYELNSVRGKPSGIE